MEEKEKIRKQFYFPILIESVKMQNSIPNKIILSKIYIDCKKATCNAKGKILIGNLIYDKILSLKADAIGGLTLGADPIANAVSYASEIRQDGHSINTLLNVNV